jgi:hypothetical protein
MIGQSNHALEAVGYKNAPSFIGVWISDPLTVY